MCRRGCKRVTRGRNECGVLKVGGQAWERAFGLKNASEGVKTGVNR